MSNYCLIDGLVGVDYGFKTILRFLIQKTDSKRLFAKDLKHTDFLAQNFFQNIKKTATSRTQTLMIGGWNSTIDNRNSTALDHDKKGNRKEREHLPLAVDGY